jgi:hypothetical protein
MNAVDETAIQTDAIQNTEYELMEVIKFIPYSGIPLRKYEALMLMRSAARTLVRNNDMYFKK